MNAMVFWFRPMQISRDTRSRTVPEVASFGLSVPVAIRPVLLARRPRNGNHGMNNGDGAHVRV